jgi:hypothetical protein
MSIPNLGHEGTIPSQWKAVNKVTTIKSKLSQLAVQGQLLGHRIHMEILHLPLPLVRAKVQQNSDQKSVHILTFWIKNKSSNANIETIRKCLCLKGWLRSKNQEEMQKYLHDAVSDKMLGNY